MSSSPCIDCKILPKLLPKHRCGWCESKKLGTDFQAGNTYTQWFAGDSPEHCETCNRDVPSFMMKNKKRCRGCQILLDRQKRSERLYGGIDRQGWYEAQGGVCYACKRSQRFTGLATHHDHHTNEAKFLACVRCNRAFGEMNDDPYVAIRFGLGHLISPHAKGGPEAINAILAQIQSYTEA